MENIDVTFNSPHNSIIPMQPEPQSVTTKRTVTEEFDQEGRMIKRITVEETVTHGNRWPLPGPTWISDHTNWEEHIKY